VAGAGGNPIQRRDVSMSRTADTTVSLAILSLIRRFVQRQARPKINHAAYIHHHTCGIASHSIFSKQRLEYSTSGGESILTESYASAGLGPLTLVRPSSDQSLYFLLNMSFKLPYAEDAGESISSATMCGSESTTHQGGHVSPKSGNQPVGAFATLQ
jgi:hypothetical protein